jgi:serine/threonine-protein kinase HipA
VECLVTVQLRGEDVPCGRLYTHVRRGVESASFAYDRTYLVRGDAFPLSPDLPLYEGTIHAAGRSLFGAFEDCMPDRWGRNLLLRAERNAARAESRTARSLFEGDLLVGVSDQTRQGALRIWLDGEPVARQEGGVPREVDIPRLLSQADLAERDMDADVRDLLRAGSSLGGPRRRPLSPTCTGACTSPSSRRQARRFWTTRALGSTWPSPLPGAAVLLCPRRACCGSQGGPCFSSSASTATALRASRT